MRRNRRKGQQARSASYRSSSAATHPAERVDMACRRMFPLGFAVCNAIYWFYYLHLTNEERVDDAMEDGSMANALTADLL